MSRQQSKPQPGWWRSNRWWLPALPVALILCLAASGHRVQTFWWEEGTHKSVGRDATDGFRSASLVGSDAHGDLSRTFQAKVGTPRQIDSITVDGDEQPVPAGSAAWRVPIEFRADPDQELNDCRIAAYDDDGRQYGGGISEIVDQRNLCLVAGQEGPAYALLSEQPRGQVEPGHGRPEAWTVRPVILTKAGVELTKVRIWFNYPEYLELPIRQ